MRRKKSENKKNTKEFSSELNNIKCFLRISFRNVQNEIGSIATKYHVNFIQVFHSLNGKIQMKRNCLGLELIIFTTMKFLDVQINGIFFYVALDSFN